ncbi:PPP4R2-domain-containing protein [Glomus cerebriforme]|uniref:PPP4R2-domain-containing protein n=1 Tax=Glomus cerebriforme TaxID=658196 RepID=A0A397TJY4_9GLOM|nr:PPP4R2-domain-containing protein [Glomus cerebriforme]
MSSFFSFFYSKPKAEEVMATTSLNSKEPTTNSSKSTTEDSQSEPQSPVNLLSPPRQTQPPTSPSHSSSSQPSSQPQTPKEQELSKHSTVSEELTLVFKSVSWSKVMRIIRERLEKTCQESNIQIAINGDNEKHKTDVENYKQTINQLLDNFEGPPFTIQRLSELILMPFQHHKTLIKWLRAVEKVLTVQSSLDAFPSISNTITLTDKLELMEVTTSPKLVPISFAYNAEEIEKENANSPKLVPIKFTYNAELEVADNEEEVDDDMNEDYYYEKQEIDTPEDDLGEMDEEKMQNIEENYDMFAEQNEDNVGKVVKKKRDYNIEDDMIDENEGNVKKMIKKKRDDVVEDKMIEEDGENIFEDVEKDDVDSLFEEKNKTIEVKEKGKENAGGKIMEDKSEKREKIGAIIKDNINKKNISEIDEKTIKERSEDNVEKFLDYKIERAIEGNVEDNKEKNKDQEKELFKGKNENKVFLVNEEKTEEEKLKEIKEKIKMRIK